MYGSRPHKRVNTGEEKGDLEKLLTEELEDGRGPLLQHTLGRVLQGVPCDVQTRYRGHIAWRRQGVCQDYFLCKPVTSFTC